MFLDSWKFVYIFYETLITLIEKFYFKSWCIKFQKYQKTRDACFEIMYFILKILALNLICKN